MHGREKVELFPPAREDDMSVRGAAEFAYPREDGVLVVPARALGW